MVQQARAATLVAMVVVLSSTLASCDWPFGSDYEDRIALVGPVSVPDTVRAGESFPAVFLSYGNNGCWRKGNDEVHMLGTRVLITPHDLAYVGSGRCTADIPSFRHQVVLRFRERGTAWLGVRTRFSYADGRDSVIARTVEVQ